MAFFSRHVRVVEEVSVFVAPAKNRRQLCLLQMKVERLGDDGNGMNVVVIPVPRSLVRDPILYDSSKYSSAFSDLSGWFDAANHLSKSVQDIYFGPGPGGHKIIYCDSVLAVEEARIDTVSLRIPRRVVRLLEQQYNSDDWGFWVGLFAQKHAAVRLHLSFSHPLMRNRIYVPLPVFSPKGIAFGERDDICNDEAPAWPKATVYAANVSISAFPTDGTQSLEAHQQSRSAQSKHNSGLVLSALPIELEGGRPVVLIRSQMQPVRDQAVWLPLASAFVGLQRALSAAESGNVRGAKRVFASLAQHKGNSTVLAHYAAFCASQGDQDMERELFEAAAAQNRFNPEVYVLMGQCATSSRRKVKAFRAALALDPYDSRALVGLAKSLPDDGVQAEKLLHRALLLHPSNVQAAVRLETLADETCTLDHERADQMRLSERESKQKAVQHITTYLKMLNNERLVLFPGQTN